MARDPGSKWAPLPEAGAPDGYTKTQLIFHATGGTGSAKAIRDNWFGRSDVVVESTFIIGKSPADPTLQMMDSTDNADANSSANQRAISVEVVCTGSEPYTAWQVSECIRIGRWAAAHHPIQRRICPRHDASGFGWHVMFGAPGPWTPAVGKVCPGNPAIQQLKTVIFPAIFASSTASTPAPKPTPKPEEGPLMALSDAQQKQLLTDVAEIKQLLTTPVKRTGVLPDDSVQEARPVDLLRYADGNALRARRLDEAHAQDAAVSGT